MHLRFCLEALMQGQTVTQVERGAGLARGSIDGLLRASDVRMVLLRTVERLSRYFTIGLAPAPPSWRTRESDVSTPPPILAWKGGHLHWNLGGKEGVLAYWGVRRYELMLATGRFPNTVYPLADGTTERTTFGMLAAVALATDAPLGGASDGKTPRDWLFAWEGTPEERPHVRDFLVAHQADACLVDGCLEQPVAQGLCLNHYMQVRSGKPVDDLRPSARKASKPCRWTDPSGVTCSRHASIRGYCYTHYRMVRKQEREGADKHPNPKEDASS